MFQVGTDWNPKQARLKELLAKPEKFEEAKELCLQLHSIVHSSEITPGIEPTLLDEVWEGLTEKAFLIMPTVKDVTVAWNIWHITRIEDITANILIGEREQVLDEEWLERLGVRVRDTGNAMTDEEILALSRQLVREELKSYRDAVGVRTKEIINNLTSPDLKRKVKGESIARILKEGGVTEQEDSIWLLDFWGKKNVAGIILMPITRHQAGHLNDCIKLKKKLQK
ncbi:DinB superfamily protein [Anaerocolumna jejuensis DSM 15929]|uniref:DinB superfamily protein n=1 Tax=Anaerocolumna jejuensis DSM 15929 TaxID=1121322 RepID=A0A1M6VDQ5_9FIRM|nr:DinB family protein [Anaerocolumna jejuensis]SHK79677.1 DinB superfamily protein [Anaerocolumna jejuensis DSM 15929]